MIRLTYRRCLSGIGLAFLSCAAAGVYAADPQAGEQRAIGCSGCHNEAKNDLAGMDAKWLTERMTAMRAAEGSAHPPVFGLLTTADLEDMAAYFAGIAR